jgi:hypothetical protein
MVRLARPNWLLRDAFRRTTAERNFPAGQCILMNPKFHASKPAASIIKIVVKFNRSMALCLALSPFNAVAESEAAVVRTAINENLCLAQWEVDNPVAWELAVVHDERLRIAPEWVKRSISDRFALVSKLVRTELPDAKCYAKLPDVPKLSSFNAPDQETPVLKQGDMVDVDIDLAGEVTNNGSNKSYLARKIAGLMAESLPGAVLGFCIPGAILQRFSKRKLPAGYLLSAFIIGWIALSLLAAILDSDIHKTNPGAALAVPFLVSIAILLLSKALHPKPHDRAQLFPPLQTKDGAGQYGDSGRAVTVTNSSRRQLGLLLLLMIVCIFICIAVLILVGLISSMY